LESLRLRAGAQRRPAGMKMLLREAFGYAVASGVAFAVDVTILFVLVHYFAWWYLAAACTSFLVGLVVAYLISVKLVFKHHRLDDRRAEFVAFAAIGLIALAINAAAMFIGVKYLGLHYIAAKFLAAGITFVCSFVSRRQILFVRRTMV